MVTKLQWGAREKLVTRATFYPSNQVMRALFRIAAFLAFVVISFLASAQTSAVDTLRTNWHDAKRDRDVPVKIYFPATGNGPFPVIVFSHGLGGSRDGYEFLGRNWASHGYVSVHLQHIGSDDAVWRSANGGDPLTSMRRAAAQPHNAIDRVLDVSFAIDQLEILDREKSSFSKRLDLDHIGVAGHSFGAHTTLAVAGQIFNPLLARSNSLADPRVKAAIPMSAPAPPNKKLLDECYEQVKIPCLHMTGTKDSSPIGDTTPEERRLPFDHCKNSDQFLSTFKNGDHMIFSGRPRVMGGGEKTPTFTNSS
jgi:predicted dienelactone hydrolase